MTILLFGESCTGKSTIADALRTKLNARVYSGKDYLRLAKSQSEAEEQFRRLLCDSEENIIYVASQTDQLTLAPESCVRVLVTASLETIQARFSKRTGGKLPPPVAQMLERKHGCFDGEKWDLRFDTDAVDAQSAAEEIAAYLAGKPLPNV